MVAYPRSSLYALIGFKVVRTDQNDRTRSHLSTSKPLNKTIIDGRASSFFAKETAEYGTNWWVE